MIILAITGNPKRSGALATLTEEAVRGAEAGGADVETIRLAEKDIKPCRFCLRCREDVDSRIATCTQKDDMAEILPKIADADAFILACPMSGGHANAYMKIFEERCCFTLGKATRRILWVKGCPESRIADRERQAAVITTTGVVPAWSRVLCNGSTREMASLARGIFNARVAGTLYAGLINVRGLRERDRLKAYELGRSLAAAVRSAEDDPPRPGVAGTPPGQTIPGGSG